MKISKSISNKIKKKIKMAPLEASALSRLVERSAILLGDTINIAQI